VGISASWSHAEPLYGRAWQRHDGSVRHAAGAECTGDGGSHCHKQRVRRMMPPATKPHMGVAGAEKPVLGSARPPFLGLEMERATSRIKRPVRTSERTESHKATMHIKLKHTGAPHACVVRYQ